MTTDRVCDSVQVGKKRGAIDTESSKFVTESAPSRARYPDLPEVSAIGWLLQLGVRVGSETAALNCDPWRKVRGAELHYVLQAERRLVPAIGPSATVVVVAPYSAVTLGDPVLNCKVESSQRVRSPVKEARGETVVLGERKPLPGIVRLEMRVRPSTALEVT